MLFLVYSGTLWVKISLWKMFYMHGDMPALNLPSKVIQISLITTPHLMTNFMRVTGLGSMSQLPRHLGILDICELSERNHWLDILLAVLLYPYQELDL